MDLGLRGARVAICDVDGTQAAIEVMRETDTGSIVFIASDAAFGEIRQAHLASC